MNLKLANAMKEIASLKIQLSQLRKTVMK